jgi:hypothetical protein
MTERGQSRVGVSRVAARAQAEAMLAVLETAEPGLQLMLRHDPAGVLGSRTDLAVRAVPEAQTDAGCSVAGAYIGDNVPPVLAVATSTSSGRRAFTLLHEFGHHLQRTETTLMPALLDQPDDGHALEDAACDAFAATVLLPDELVEAHVAAAGPTADDVVALWRASTASRAAVCVRAVERLPSPGHVLLLDSQGDVQFAAAHGLPPVRRGSSQARIPVVGDALTNGRHRARGHTRVAYRDGIAGGELYAQAADIGGYLLVVAVTDRAPWERFAPPSRDEAPSGQEWTCEQCGHEFVTFQPPCRRCGAPTCPDCGRCNCAARVEERRCDGCSLVLPARLFAGTASRCRDCS